jgi:hypothetical protein
VSGKVAFHKFATPGKVQPPLISYALKGKLNKTAGNI